MHRTAEQKANGRANFQDAIASQYIRQDFLKEALKQNLTSGDGLGGYYFGYDKTVSEPVRVGVLGTGDHGGLLIGAVNPDFIQVKSIADIRPYNRHRAFHGDWTDEKTIKLRCGLIQKFGFEDEDAAKKQVKVHEDFHSLIENAKTDGVEAVIIALPLHLHAEATVLAMQAGLQVFTEKLMAHSVLECKQMARAARETGKLLAVGHQRHYNILHDHALNLIDTGILGDIHFIRAQCHRHNKPGKDSWRPVMPASVKPDDDRAGWLESRLPSWERKLSDVTRKEQSEDINIWTGLVAQLRAQIADGTIDAKQYGYEDAEWQYTDEQGNTKTYNRPAIEELIRWRLFNRTGGGLMTELGGHQIDAAAAFITAAHRSVDPDAPHQRPLCVEAFGCRSLFPPDRHCDDHMHCMFEYAAPDFDPRDPDSLRKKITVQYTAMEGNGFGGISETVFGTKATMITENEVNMEMFKAGSTDRVGVELEKGEKRLVAGDDQAAVALGMTATVDASRGFTEELEHWAWCIRNQSPENRPKCDPEIALTDAVVALTANEAVRQGRRIEFKDEWFEIDSDATPEQG